MSELDSVSIHDGKDFGISFKKSKSKSKLKFSIEKTPSPKKSQKKNQLLAEEEPSDSEELLTSKILNSDLNLILKQECDCRNSSSSL